MNLFDVLSLNFLGDVEIVGFADDIVLTVKGETVEEVEMLAMDAIERIERWMRAAKQRTQNATGGGVPEVSGGKQERSL